MLSPTLVHQNNHKAESGTTPKRQRMTHRGKLAFLALALLVALATRTADALLKRVQRPGYRVMRDTTGLHRGGGRRDLLGVSALGQTEQEQSIVEATYHLGTYMVKSASRLAVDRLLHPSIDFRLHRRHHHNQVLIHPTTPGTIGT